MSLSGGEGAVLAAAMTATTRSPAAALGMVASISRAGDALANTMAESFFATIKAELPDAQRRPTRGAPRPPILEWVEGLYNRRTRHSALNSHPPRHVP